MVDITQRTPAIGALKGAKRMSSSRKAMVAALLSLLRCWVGVTEQPSNLATQQLSFRALQLQPDIDEVVRRPRSRVEERQLVLVLFRDVGDLVVERLRLLAIDEERGVHDHLVA